MNLSKIAVLGMGNVGSLAADLLHQSGFEVSGYDLNPQPNNKPYPVGKVDIADLQTLQQSIEDTDGVLSCLPYHLNTRVAETAHSQGKHYFDLTEDVPTTKAIMRLAKTSKGLMAPQCGLAPGFVGIVGADQIKQFDHCRSLRLRVGALPQNPTGLLGYAFNWSPEGVVNEYLNDCEVLEDGEIKWVSPMEWHETLYINGTKLEAFTTSGGLGTMCETYLGRVDNIDYKTMRYPGHMKLMNFFFHELLMRKRREIAGDILTHAKPPVKDDIVYIHISSEGEINGRLKRREFVRGLKPKEINGVHQTAISWTTAASAVGVIEMVRNNTLPQKGFLKQEEIPYPDFIKTTAGTYYNQV